MKLSVLISPRFQATLRKLNNLEIPAKTAFRLKGITKLVQEQIDRYEEVRLARLEVHGDRTEGGSLILTEENSVQLSPDGLKNLVNDMTELASEEVDLPTIKINDLGNVSLTVEDLLALDGLVVE